MKMKRAAIHTAFWLAAVILVVLLHGAQVRIDREKRVEFIDRSPVFLPDGEALKWLSLGYRSMTADWLWINTVLYIGRRLMDEDNPYFLYALFRDDREKLKQLHENSAALFDEENYRAVIRFRDRLDADRGAAPQPPDSLPFLNKRSFESFYRFEHRGMLDYVCPLVERITTLNPYFTEPYIFAGLFAAMEIGEIDWSIALLEKGHEYNPRRWEFPYYLGWLYWIYKGDLQKTHAFLLAASQLEGCPRGALHILAGITRNLEIENLTALYLTGMLENTQNPTIQKQLTDILNEIKLKNP